MSAEEIIELPEFVVTASANDIPPFHLLAVIQVFNPTTVEVYGYSGYHDSNWTPPNPITSGGHNATSAGKQSADCMKIRKHDDVNANGFKGIEYRIDVPTRQGGGLYVQTVNYTVIYADGSLNSARFTEVMPVYDGQALDKNFQPIGSTFGDKNGIFFSTYMSNKEAVSINVQITAGYVPGDHIPGEDYHNNADGLDVTLNLVNTQGASTGETKSFETGELWVREGLDYDLLNQSSQRVSRSFTAMRSDTNFPEPVFQFLSGYGPCY